VPQIFWGEIMALSDEQVVWLRTFFEDCKTHEGKLSDWERGFVSDLEEKFDKYEADVRVSEKQGAILKRIYKKFREADQGGAF
jgi:hypothetical protein